MAHKITRDDLEARFRSLQHEAQNKVRSKQQTFVTVAGVGSVVLLLLFFALGRRSGRKKTTIVEIRRV